MIIKEKYISNLFKKNKSCSCGDLVRFAHLDEQKKNLENLCHSLLESLTNFHKGNMEVIELYQKRLYDLEIISGEQNIELNSLIKKDKLNLFYHNEKEDYKKEKINFEQGRELMKDKKIITVNCYNCAQQIAIVSK
ncbi:MAG: hypothetical protein AABX80_01275 [Nanoarchaeota archaeon]